MKEEAGSLGFQAPGQGRYSQETKAAHGELMVVCLTSDKPEIDAALRHLAMMVHCDLTGELRGPHTHTTVLRCPAHGGCGFRADCTSCHAICANCNAHMDGDGICPDCGSGVKEGSEDEE